ncbi:MAG: hypothetical protein OEN20_09480, partial [Gammaproteobacteria bacterium]|nr:hypothetical protein [Gammaproteobacteria bacterium]
MVRALSARWLDAVLIAVALCALSLVVAPLITGYLVVNRVNATLQRLSLLHNIQWSVVRSEQGWFQTLLYTELRIAGYAPVPAQLALVHGPVYLGMLQQQRSPFLLAYLRATPAGTYTAPEFQAVLRFNGDWSAHLEPQDLTLHHLD